MVPDIYHHRDYVAHKLSDAAFAVLNKAGWAALSVSVSGCLDAPESIPTGCMRGFSGRDGMRYVTMDTIDRGLSQAERERREEISRRLIDEVLAEEAAKNAAKQRN